MPPPSIAPLKYVVGIDIAKDTFVACFGRMEISQLLRFGKQATFPNTAAGFVALLAWTIRQQGVAAPLWFVVEATGVYYEELAYFLADKAQALSVLLPNKVKHFAQSTEQKSKTDHLDARLLCRLGLERVLPAWQPSTSALRQSVTQQGAGVLVTTGREIAVSSKTLTPRALVRCSSNLGRKSVA